MPCSYSVSWFRTKLFWVVGPITSWEIDGETVETVSDLILGGSKITADGDCSHEIKRCLLLGRKVMTNLDIYMTNLYIQKQRHYFANKGPSSQGYGFSSGHVRKWELDCEESWVPKNWCFELWCWRRLLRVPWTARRFNHSILKEISPGISLEGMMLKLKLQYSGHLMWRVDSLEKTLMLGGIEGRRRRGRQRIRCGWHHWLNGREFEWTPGVGDGHGVLACCDSWVAKSRTWLSDWNELNWTSFFFLGEQFW